MKFKPFPKPQPKPKVSYDARYWAGLRTKSVKKKLDNAKDFLAELKLWHRKIYDKYKGTCQESGRPLSFSKNYCAHLLPKSSFPQFATDERNGILIDLKYHSILDKGSESQRLAMKTWRLIRKRRRELLAEVGVAYDESYWLKMTV